ncbi:MAG TPA: hypothetical protein VJ813_03040 [Vicinamibacterales bacterium]|nr:hypothetical protein [Vicinamibacterales bacterium]
MHEVALISLTLLLGGMPAFGQTTAAPVVKVDAVSAILDAFAQVPVVALEEPHGDERAHAFRLALVRDPRFPPVVDDIVVEFGNSRYQDVMDRFVAGEPVGAADLRKVWQDTTQAHTIWDRPIYEHFFRAVRDVNLGLARDVRLRVLLGDPPIDWQTVHTPDDRRKWLQMGRSTYPVDVIRREVLKKGRRALVVYGAYHLIRNNLAGPNLSERLEAATGIRPFVVLTHPTGNLEVMRVDPAALSTRSLALTKGTTLEGQMDGILYLGPPSHRRTSRLDASLCADAAYRTMRTGRMRLVGMSNAEEELARECQAQPDFSGVWKPDGADTPTTPPPAVKPGDRPPPPPPPRTLLATITQSATEMRLERRVETGGREVVYTLAYKFDGTESVNQVGPLIYRTKASWAGGQLTLTSIISVSGNATGELTEVYRLDGADLIVESNRKVPAGTFSDRVVYRRVPPR